MPWNNSEHVPAIILLVLGSIVGVYVKYTAWLVREGGTFSKSLFFTEILGHWFAGLLTFMFFTAIGVSTYLSLTLALLASYIGLKMLNKLETEILDGLNGISDLMKRLFK